MSVRFQMPEVLVVCGTLLALSGLFTVGVVLCGLGVVGSIMRASLSYSESTKKQSLND